MPDLVTMLRYYWLRDRTEPSRERARNIAYVRPLSPVGLEDFLALDIPPREMLLNPILPGKSLSMLYAPRGMGKTWLGLSIGLAVASGGPLLRWSSPGPKRVLHVDGEMAVADIQNRLALISAGLGCEIPNDGFRIIAADQVERGIDLNKPEVQQALEHHLGGVDLLVLDNQSTLTTMSEGASDAWLPFQLWLLRLRRKGIAVLIIHHAGVNGRQRGTSRREDALDTVIALRRPEDYSPEQGCRFEVHIEKLRHHAGDGAVPFEASIESLTNEAGREAIRWICRDLAPPVLHQAAHLYRQGFTVRQVEAALGISHGLAGRLRQRAAAEGLLVAAADEEEPRGETALGGHSRLN